VKNLVSPLKRDVTKENNFEQILNSNLLFKKKDTKVSGVIYHGLDILDNKIYHGIS
jgi:hypothetical protein